MKKIILTILSGLLFWAFATWVLKDIPESDSWFTLDTLFHFVGGIFAAWCGVLFSKRKLTVFAVAMLIGVLWEVAEHLSSVFGPTYWPVIYNYYHGGNLLDTIHDLFADMLGAVSFILLYYYYQNAQEK